MAVGAVGGIDARLVPVEDASDEYLAPVREAIGRVDPTYRASCAERRPGRVRAEVDADGRLKRLAVHTRCRGLDGRGSRGVIQRVDEAEEGGHVDAADRAGVDAGHGQGAENDAVLFARGREYGHAVAFVRDIERHVGLADEDRRWRLIRVVRLWRQRRGLGDGDGDGRVARYAEREHNVCGPGRARASAGHRDVGYLGAAVRDDGRGYRRAPDRDIPRLVERPIDRHADIGPQHALNGRVGALHAERLGQGDRRRVVYDFPLRREGVSPAAHVVAVVPAGRQDLGGLRLLPAFEGIVLFSRFV